MGYLEVAETKLPEEIGEAEEVEAVDEDGVEEV